MRAIHGELCVFNPGQGPIVIVAWGRAERRPRIGPDRPDRSLKDCLTV